MLRPNSLVLLTLRQLLNHLLTVTFFGFMTAHGYAMAVCIVELPQVDFFSTEHWCMLTG